MAETILLLVLAALGWGYFSEWRDRQVMEQRLQEKVALHQRYIAVARDAPSAWESFGDALRRGGYLPEAIEAYERAEMLRLIGPESRPETADQPPMREEDEPLPDGIPARAVPLLPVGAAEPVESVVLSLPALLAPVRAADDSAADMPMASSPVMALAPIQAAHSGDDLYASSEHLLAQVREDAGLSVDDGPADLPVPYTPPALPVPADAPLPVTAAPDGAVGFGVENKIRLVRLEMEQESDPAKFGQTLLTRQQVCRQCGHLNPYGLRDCESCDAPLPTDTMAEAWRHDVIRAEAIRQARNLVIGLFIITVTVWFVGWLPGLVKLSVTAASLIVIPLRLLHAIGDR